MKLKIGDKVELKTISELVKAFRENNMLNKIRFLPNDEVSTVIGIYASNLEKFILHRNLFVTHVEEYIEERPDIQKIHISSDVRNGDDFSNYYFLNIMFNKKSAQLEFDF